MAGNLTSATRKTWQTLSSIKTGVILLIAVVIISAAGTVILQRPVTEADEMQRAYSPQVLHALDALGLTDIFHAWWFVTLLVMVSLSIVAASIQRFPNSWRYYSRPYKSPDETFRKALATQAHIAIPDEENGLAAAEHIFQRAGLKPERMVRESSFAVFGERNRISEMAVYVVHASLLLIFLGGIVDALYGWRGFVAIPGGGQSSQIELHNGTVRRLPFTVRCDAAGQENYADGTPKEWWSKLAVLEDGREVMHKEIVVNDPLVYRGIRFYQASFGNTGKVDKIRFAVSPTTSPGESKPIALSPDETLSLDADTTVRMAEFIPDYVVSDGQVYTRSTAVDNPAVHLVVESEKVRKGSKFLASSDPGLRTELFIPIQLQSYGLRDGSFHRFTGLSRARPVGGLAGRDRHGFRAGPGVLPGPCAVLGAAGAGCSWSLDALGGRHGEQE